MSVIEDSSGDNFFLRLVKRLLSDWNAIVKSYFVGGFGLFVIGFIVSRLLL